MKPKYLGGRLLHAAELSLRASSHLLIVLLGVMLIALSLLSMWKENRQGEPLNGIIWFSLAIIGFCAAIALLAAYVQKARSLEKISHRMEAISTNPEASKKYT